MPMPSMHASLLLCKARISIHLLGHHLIPHTNSLNPILTALLTAPRKRITLITARNGILACCLREEGFWLCSVGIPSLVS